MLAVVTAGYHRAFPRPSSGSPKVGLTLNLLFLVILAVCTVLGYNRLKSEIHLQKAFQHESRKNWPEDTAKRRNSGHPRDFTYKFTPGVTFYTWI